MGCDTAGLVVLGLMILKGDEAVFVVIFELMNNMELREDYSTLARSIGEFLAKANMSIVS